MPPGRLKCCEPPVADVLEAEHPGLAGAVGDGRAHLVVAVGGAGVVPVVALAGDEVAAQVVEVVGRGDAGCAVEVVGAVAPVGERPVDVDADGVDVGRGPQRVEVEIDVAGAVGGLVAEVLGPVGGVGDFGARAEHRLDVGGERHEAGHERIGAGAAAHLAETAQLRADQEGVDAAGGGGEVRVVENEAAVGPFGWPRVDHGTVGDGEVGDRRGAEEGSDLRGRGGGLVGSAGLAGGGGDGDAAAPGVGRLRGSAGGGVGQRVAGRHIHEDEGRERDGEAARVEVLDGGDDGLVRRRAAIGGAAFVKADEVGGGARYTGHGPGQGRGYLVGGVDAGAESAGAGAQIVAEPADHQRD
jgi:hypothetical protein